MAEQIIIAGVGGQGTVAAGHVLAMAGLYAGFDVKLSEIHGMAQRGGSVLSQIRFGQKVLSPVIEKGSADLMIAFEWLEALRYLDLLKEDAPAIVNDARIEPLSVRLGISKYPEAAAKEFGSRHPLTIIDGMHETIQFGNPKVLNMILLGVASVYLPIDAHCWIRAIKEQFPKAVAPDNVRAFQYGAEHFMERTFVWNQLKDREETK